MDDAELRKWSVEQASQAGAGADVVQIAQELFEFVKKGQETVQPLANATSLTPKQIEVMQTLTELLRAGKKAHGSAVAEAMGITQSYASSMLRKLIELGYVSRDGNKFWPVKKVMTNPSDIIKKKIENDDPNGVKDIYYED